MCKGSQSQVTGAKTNLTNIMNRKDVLLKEIELIQAKIDKVEKTSFVIKGWVITMVTAVLALLPETIDKLILGIVVGVSVIAFEETSLDDYEGSDCINVRLSNNHLFHPGDVAVYSIQIGAKKRAIADATSLLRFYNDNRAASAGCRKNLCFRRIR